MKAPKVLFISGSAGLGHVTRDLAIATELRAHWPGLQLVWLAADPARLVLRQAGEPLTPECAQFAGETGWIEQLARGFGLPLTDPLAPLCRPVWLVRTILSLHREQKSNFELFLQASGREKLDLVVADEAYDLMLALARRPKNKPSPLAMIYDFVGIERTSKSPLERLWVQALNWAATRLAKRIPLFCDRTLFVGEEEDVADRPFGLLLPNRRKWAAGLLTYLGYVLPFHPEGYQDQAAVRKRLGYGPEPMIICAIGGTRIGQGLLELCGRAYPILRERLPSLRMIAVAGPRLDPATLHLPEGVERRGYVHYLYEHLAATDLAIVQGGGTTTLELTALRRPFIYFPLEGHFEQRIHVARRIERHHAGLRMEYRETTPASLATAVCSLIGKPVKYPPIRAGGAKRAAEVLSELLERRFAHPCRPEIEERQPIPKHSPGGVAFALVELLVVIGVIGILAALILPAMSRAKAAARRIECSNNLKQVSLGLLMYADDFGHTLPGRSPAPPGVHGWYAFKSLMKSYVGLSGPSSVHDRVFSCPADTFYYNDGTNFPAPYFYSSGAHEQPWTDYSSFDFNCGNLITNAYYKGVRQQFPGVGEERLSAIHEPTRTVLVAESPALIPYSWHQPRRRVPGAYPFTDAICTTSFIDGHVQYLRFYWDRTLACGVESWHYDPPANYEYRWSAR